MGCWGKGRAGVLVCTGTPSHQFRTLGFDKPPSRRHSPALHIDTDPGRLHVDTDDSSPTFCRSHLKHRLRQLPLLPTPRHSRDTAKEPSDSRPRARETGRLCLTTGGVLRGRAAGRAAPARARAAAGRALTHTRAAILSAAASATWETVCGSCVLTPSVSVPRTHMNQQLVLDQARAEGQVSSHCGR
jgi:hypothetical protein